MCLRSQVQDSRSFLTVANELRERKWCLCVAFDKSLNNVTQPKQLDVQLRHVEKWRSQNTVRM